jgi:hypothetical protein
MIKRSNYEFITHACIMFKVVKSKNNLTRLFLNHVEIYADTYR